MASKVFRYQFDDSVPMEEVEGSLLLAILGVESLHGETEVQLSASHFLDVERRTCVIDAGTETGTDLNRLFAGFLRREFGKTNFTVRRIDSFTRSQQAE